MNLTRLGCVAHYIPLFLSLSLSLAQVVDAAVAALDVLSQTPQPGQSGANAEASKRHLCKRNMRALDSSKKEFSEISGSVCKSYTKKINAAAAEHRQPIGHKQFRVIQVPIVGARQPHGGCRPWG